MYADFCRIFSAKCPREIFFLCHLSLGDIGEHRVCLEDLINVLLPAVEEQLLEDSSLLPIDDIIRLS